MADIEPHPPRRDDLLESVVARFLEAAVNGADLDRPKLIAENPSIAAELTDFFNEHDRLRALVSPLNSAVHANGQAPKQFGDYVILREIGRGGMGVVYEAEEPTLGRRVALKVLPLGIAIDERQRRRFMLEAQAAAQLDHKHIVPVYAVGRHEGVHYYSMRLIQGRSLARIIRDRERLEPRELARLGRQAADALDFAHQQGIIHRDIKPSNLLLDETDHVWVADFGLARVGSEPGITITGDVLGSLRYMSPEQALGVRGIVDQRADVYGLGVTLYELLTRAPVITAADRPDILRQIERHAPTPPRRINPAIPRDLETIVLKAIAREPEARYPTAKAMAEDLGRFLETRPIKARRPTVVERLGKWSRRNLRVVAAASLAFAIAAIGLGIGLVIVQRERDRAQRADADLTWELYVSRVHQAYGEWEAGNVTRAEAILDACPRIHRNWEWRYVKRLCHAELVGFQAHGAGRTWGVIAAEFVDGDRCVVTAATSLVETSSISEMRLWNAATGRMEREFNAHSLPTLRSLATKPDAKSIATLHEVNAKNTVALWSIDRADPVKLIPLDDGGLSNGPNGLVFTPDGRKLVIPLGWRYALVDLESGRQSWSYENSGWRIRSRVAAISPDGARFALGGTRHRGVGNIQIREMNTADKILDIESHVEHVLDLAYRPVGSDLASVGVDNTVRIWNATTGALRLSLSGHQGYAFRVAYSADGSLLATSGMDQVVRIWDADTGRELRGFRGHPEHVFGLAFSRSGHKLVSASRDGLVRIWDADSNPRAAIVATGTNWISDARYAPSGASFAFADHDGVVRVHEARTGRMVKTLISPKPQSEFDGVVFSARFSSDARRIVTRHHRAYAQVLSDLSAETPKRLPLPASGINNDMAIFIPRSDLIAAPDSAGVIHICDAETGKQVKEFAGHAGSVWALAATPDGRHLASYGADGNLCLWDASTGQRIWRIEHGPQRSKGLGGQVIAFDAAGTMLAHAAGPDGYGPHAIRLHDAKTGVLIRVMHDEGGMINSVCFSPDGSRIVTGSADRLIKLWDVARGVSMLTLRGHASEVTTVEFSPDGERILSGSVDRTVREWHAPGSNGTSINAARRP